MNGAGGTHSHIRTVSMKLSYKGTKRMAFKLAISSSERPFCLIAILISVFSATLRAQTPGEIDAHSFSSSLPTFSFCDQRAADCSSNSTAVPPQPGPGQSDPSSSNSHKNDWVHSWLVKWTRLVPASLILFRPLSQLTSCWCSNSAMTCPGSRILRAGR